MSKPMEDWNAYSQTKSSGEQLTKATEPSPFEYAWIKLVDNAGVAVVVTLIILFAAVGCICAWKNIACSSNFFDLTKVALGTFLGMLTQKGLKR